MNEKTGGKLRNAIAAESGQACDINISLEVISKNGKERGNIEDALKENTFMKSMNKDQQNLIIDVMTKRTYNAGAELIKEGSDGNEMYILEKGEVIIRLLLVQKCSQYLVGVTVSRDPVCLTHENEVVNFCLADFRTLYGSYFKRSFKAQAAAYVALL